MNKLMIVDDSSTMRKIIIRTLHRAGILVEATVEASNGNEAIAQLVANPDIELVLCDVNMPDMGGLTLLRKVREIRNPKELPFILISAEGGDAIREEAMKDGANGYISKPFTPESILSTLRPYIG